MERDFNMLDLVIIGAGPVGLYAAHLAALHNLSGVVLEARDNFGGQLSNLYPQKDIIDLPGFSRITAQGFIDNLSKQIDSRENHLKIELMESVTNFEKIDGGYKIVTLNNNIYEAKCILLVTGMGTFTPRKIGLPNEGQFKNIAYAVKNKEIYKNKKVVVLGGGDSAVDLTLMLNPLVSDISIVHRRDEFRAQASVVDELKASKAHIYTPFNVTKLIGNSDVLTGIEITNNVTNEVKTIELDNLIVNFGLIPGVNKFNVEKKGPNILVKDSYQTSLENVFAIGNCINYPGKVKNITCGLGEAVVAITKIDQILNPNKNIPVHF